MGDMKRGDAYWNPYLAGVLLGFGAARGLLAELYERYGRGPDGLDNILRVHSLDPPSMAHHYELYEHLMRGPSPLSRVQREMLAVTVSAVNRCFY